MRVREINHYKDLNLYPHSRRYQGISGMTFIICAIITHGMAFFALVSYKLLLFFIIWMLFTIIFPEIRYLIYASKDKIYYLRKYAYDGDLAGSICDGIFCSTVVQIHCSFMITAYLLDDGIMVTPYLFLICPIILIIPFIFVCIRVTSIKTKIWCFFKYVIWYELLLTQGVYFASGVAIKW